MGLIYRKVFYSREAGRVDGVPRAPSRGQYLPYRERTQQLVDALAARPFEEWRMEAFDGLSLRGRFYRFADGAPTALCFHGYRSKALIDFCGGFEILRACGFNALLVDERAHGLSGGCDITFGVKERRDCLDWCREAVRRLGAEVPLVLFGVSMGAATVLMASELPLPGSVRGIVADCPYSSPAAIIAKVCGDMHLPARLLMPVVRAVARRKAGFSLDESAALEAVKRARVPILVIHGEDDRFVPCEMGRAIADAGPTVRLATFPGAGHALSYMVDSPRYEHLVVDFLRSALAKSE